MKRRCQALQQFDSLPYDQQTTGQHLDASADSLWGVQVALSGDAELLVVHAPLPYSRMYNTPGDANSGNIYTYKLVRPQASVKVQCCSARIGLDQCRPC